MVLFELGLVCFVEILQQNKVICGGVGFGSMAPQPPNVFFHTARQAGESRLISQVMKNGASNVSSCIGAEWVEPGQGVVPLSGSTVMFGA